MLENGKTRPGAGTPERAAETAAFGRAAISCDYLTTMAAGRQRKVSDFLSHGRENAVPLRHLKKLKSNKKSRPRRVYSTAGI